MCHRHSLIGLHEITYPLWRSIPSIKRGWNITGFVANSPLEAKQLEALPMTTGTPTSAAL